MKTPTQPDCLKDHFLIAMPNMAEGIFANSVTYLCEHNEEGAMGIVINHPLDISLDDIFQHLQIEDVQGEHHDRVLAGGPVLIDRGFVLHHSSDESWDSTVRISDQIALTTSQDILAAIAQDKGPKRSLVALGYAGWGKGQLEMEIAENAWLTVPANYDVIFNTPVELRAKAAAAQLGVDLALISPVAGHA